MPGKTDILKITVGLMSLAFGVACFGADLPKLPSMMEALNARWNERILSSQKTAEPEFIPYKPSPILRPQYKPVFFCCGGGIPPFKPSKFLFLEETAEITKAFAECSSLNILILETAAPVPPRWTGAPMDDILDDYLIIAKTETSEEYAMRIMHRLLLGVLKLNGIEVFDDEEGVSISEEVKSYKTYNKFTPALIIEFKGPKWLRIEIDQERLKAILQSENGWGSYTIDKVSAELLVKYAKSICELEKLALVSAEDSSQPEPAL